MDSAPTTAGEVANDMAKAAPNLEDTRVDGSESDENGEIIVISNAGDDPKLACFKALALLDRDPEDHDETNLWKSATVEMKNWGEHLEFGFNEDDPEDLDAGLLAITKVMAERLSGHFKFSFDEDVVCAPVIYGGYAADGSIVGVLSARVWT